MKKKILIGLIVLITPLIIIYNFFPGVVLNVAISLERGSSNLEAKNIQVEDHNIVYLEGGTATAKQTVLMLHGFGADKDNWTRFAKGLAENYRLFAPDLPGFGESTRVQGARYDMRPQAERLKKFVEKIGLKNFHIIGNSMGGHLAATFALLYPTYVKSIGLVCSAGVVSPEPSEHRKSIAKGVNKLLVTDRKDYDRLMDFIFVEKPAVPGVVLDFLAERAVKNRPFNDYIYKQFAQYPWIVQSSLPQIKQPTLVLWGEKDNVIDVSSTKVFKAGMPHAKVVIMPNVGHAPMIEKPAESAKIYGDFLHSLN